MESTTISAEELIEWNKWFSACNKYVDYCRVKWIKNFGHHVYKEEDGSSEDEE